MDTRSGGVKINKLKWRMVQFEFPVKLVQTSTFPSIEAIIKSFKQQQKLLDKQNRYTFKSSKKGNYFYIACRLCECKISYKQTPEGISLIFFLNKHKHMRKFQIDEQIKVPVVKKEKQIKPPKIKKKTQKELKNQQQTINKIQKRFQIFIIFLLNNNYKFKFEWETEPNQTQEPTSSYPDLLVACTPKMVSSFRRYGQNQLIRIKKVQALIKDLSNSKKNYHVLFFTVVDSTHHQILVGICFYIDTDHCFERAIQLFLKLHSAQNVTIELTKKEFHQSNLQSLRQLNIKFVFQQQSYIQNLIARMEFSKLQKRDKVEHQIARICQQTDMNTGTQLLKQFRHRFKDSSNQSIIKMFIEQSSKVCVFNSEADMRGLKFENNIVSKLTAKIKSSLSIINLFSFLEKNMQHLEVPNRKLSRSNFDSAIFQDSRLDTLKQSLHSTVFESFMRIYVEGTTHCRVKSQTANLVIVEHIKSRVTHKIDNSSCSCKYRKQIGIPCMHFVCWVFRTGEPYETVFHDRWLIN